MKKPFVKHLSFVPAKKVVLSTVILIVFCTILILLAFHTLCVTTVTKANIQEEYPEQDSIRLLKDELIRLRKDKLMLQELPGVLRKDLLEHQNSNGGNRKKKPASSTSAYSSREGTLRNDTTVADRLYTKVRVLCWIMTQPVNLDTRCLHIQRTWGRRCHKLLFFSSTDNVSFPAIGLGTGEGRDFLTAKSFRAFRNIYKHYFNDFDWFMRTDDDSYVIMENLRYFLYDKNTSEPVYFGHKFRTHNTLEWFAGGPGIVLSKEALHRFSTEGLNKCPENTMEHAGQFDDLNIGECMRKLGVTAGDSLDSEGKSRFHCFNPIKHLKGQYPKWYFSHDANKAKSGMSSISDYAIGFHYVKPDMMHLLEYLLYHLRLYGVKFNDVSLN